MRKIIRSFAIVGIIFIIYVIVTFIIMPSTEKANQNKRVPEGVYNLDNYSSKNYPEHFILYNDNVSTDRAILYHPGNTAKDTKGCMLPGSTYNGNGFVGQSTLKFNEMKNFINSVGVKNVRVIINNKIK